jgi:hypothetical protein
MDFAKYQNSLPYPKHPTKPRYPKPGDSAEESKCEEKYCEKIKEYRQEDARLHAEFKKDCLEECGLSNYSKRDKIFNYAWDEKHGEGYYSVYSFLQDLSEFII